MRAVAAFAVGIALIAPPALAQTAGSNRPSETASTPPSTGTPGNGVTTSTTSAPEMKTGAERSPTAGAPTSSGVTAPTR